MANSTHPGHIHVADSDGAIILILGALVFVTFALGLLCDKSIPLFSYFFRPRKQYYDEYDFSDEASNYALCLDGTSSNHKMADLESGLANAHTHPSPTPSLPPSSASMAGEMRDRPSLSLSLSGSKPHLPRRSTTRYGSIMQHVLDVNGVRKMVLVVGDGDDNGTSAAGSRPGSTAGGSREGVQEDEYDHSPDEYAEWYARWRRYQEALRVQREMDMQMQRQIQAEQRDESSDEREGESVPLLGPWD
ncbi:hypothetical protein BDV06DRAFT_180924 [Aspergillus oleicola]